VFERKRKRRQIGRTRNSGNSMTSQLGVVITTPNWLVVRPPGAGTRGQDRSSRRAAAERRPAWLKASASAACERGSPVRRPGLAEN
jgi:hypothetical protein